MWTFQDNMSTLPPALPDTIRVHFHGAWQALVMSCCSSWPTTTLTVPYLHVTRFRTSSLPSNPGPRGLYTSRQDWMIQFTRFKIALSAPGLNSPEIDPWMKGRRGGDWFLTQCQGLALSVRGHLMSPAARGESNWKFLGFVAKSGLLYRVSS